MLIDASQGEYNVTIELQGLVLYTLDGSDPRSYIVTDNGVAQFDEGSLLTEGEVIQ